MPDMPSPDVAARILAPPPPVVVHPILDFCSHRLFGVEIPVPPHGGLATLRALLEAGGAPACRTLCVGLHPDDLLDGALYASDTEIGRRAGGIVFEVTHHDVFERVPQLELRLAALRSIGFRFTVEHVGAGVGVSSLLSRVRPEFLKIDCSLLHGAASPDVAHRILRNLLRMCADIAAVPIAVGLGPVCGAGAARRRTLARHGVRLQQGPILPAGSVLYRRVRAAA